MKLYRRNGIARWTALLSASIALTGLLTGQASAAPTPGDGSHIDRIVPLDARHTTVYVYSAAMDRVIGLKVLRAADTGRPHPILYLLDGAEDGIGEDGTEVSWETRTDVDDFLSDKDVTAVTVLDGRYSYYTDWLTDDPRLGRNRWTTFLTEELPPLLDAEFDGSGRNAIAGVSMSATSVLSLAEATPGLYRSVGSFSGCAETSTDPGRRYVQAVVLSGGGNPWNMWGPDGSPAWTANDPSTPANLEKLRGTNLYITAGDGSGALDDPNEQHRAAASRLESAVATCTRELQSRTTELNIPATYVYTPGGQHAWPYWQQSLHDAWPTFENSLTTETP